MVQGEIKTLSILKKNIFKSSEDSITKRRKRVMVVPAANVDETQFEYILSVASPGFRREHFQVVIDKNIMTIAAAKEASPEMYVHDHCEYDFNRWKRDFLLPDDADSLLAMARYKNGELVIRIPRGKTDKLSGLTTIYVY